MAMDDRQSQIREQAGLTESRLNEDFIEFLRKYSTPLLLVVAVAAAGFFAYRKYEERKSNTRDEARAQLASALEGGEPSPEALVAIADSFEGVDAVSSEALLYAAEAHLRAATRGVKPGSQLASDGTLSSPEDALTPEERDAELAAAKSLFDRVIAENPQRDRTVIRLYAMWGLAAIAESKSDFAQAKQLYEQIETQSRAAGYEDNAKIARARIDSLATLENAPPLVSRSDLPPVPVPPMPSLMDLPTMPSTDPAAAPQAEPAPATEPAPSTAPSSAEPASEPAADPATPPANP